VEKPRQVRGIPLRGTSGRGGQSPKINRRKTMGSSPRRVFLQRRSGRNSGFTWLEICIRPTLPAVPPPRCVYKSLDWDSRSVPPLSTSRDGRYCHGCEIYARYRRCSIIRGSWGLPRGRGVTPIACSNQRCAIDAPREICIISHARSRDLALIKRSQ